MVDAISTTSGESDFIYLLGWRLVDDFEMIPCDPTTTVRRLLADDSSRGVQIRAMLWNHPQPVNVAPAARINDLPTGAAIIDDKTPKHINTTGSHHEKVLIVKAGGQLIGFCGGLDINSDRIDPCLMASRSRVRSWSGGSSGGFSGGTGPLHDTHCQVVGPSAWDLLQVFIRRWDHHPRSDKIDARRKLVGRSERIPTAFLAPPRGSSKVRQVCSVVVARTFTPVTKRKAVPKERDIRALLLQAIAHAQRFIYMEDRYLINREAAVALNAAVPRLQHLTIFDHGVADRQRTRVPVEISSRFHQGLEPRSVAG